MSERSRRHFGVQPAVDPTSGRLELEVYFTHLRAEAVRSRGAWAIMEMAYLVPEILTQPSAIFEGIRADGDDDAATDGWLCYCGTPTRCYRCNPDGSARESAAYPGQVFLVFVNRERVAYNWRWEKADSFDGSLPQSWTERFVRRVL